MVPRCFEDVGCSEKITHHQGSGFLISDQVYLALHMPSLWGRALDVISTEKMVTGFIWCTWWYRENSSKLGGTGEETLLYNLTSTLKREAADQWPSLWPRSCCSLSHFVFSLRLHPPCHFFLNVPLCLLLNVSMLESDFIRSEETHWKPIENPMAMVRSKCLGRCCFMLFPFFPYRQPAFQTPPNLGRNNVVSEALLQANEMGDWSNRARHVVLFKITRNTRSGMMSLVLRLQPMKSLSTTLLKAIFLDTGETVSFLGVFWFSALDNFVICCWYMFRSGRWITNQWYWSFAWLFQLGPICCDPKNTCSWGMQNSQKKICRIDTYIIIHIYIYTAIQACSSSWFHMGIPFRRLARWTQFSEPLSEDQGVDCHAPLRESGSLVDWGKPGA